MKNILAVLLTLVLFCVPYALGYAMAYLSGEHKTENWLIIYMFGVLFFGCIVSMFFLMHRTYLWIKNMIK